MKSSGLFSAIGVLALSLLTLMLLNEWDGRLPSDKAKAKIAPLIIAYNITGKNFTPEGYLEYRVHAEQLIENDADNTTELVQPDVHIFQQDSRPQWHITSRNALYTSRQNQLTLSGDVYAQQLDAERLSIESDAITYFSKQERISTQHPVRVKQGANITTAGGMQADANTGILELFSPVESRYAMP